MDEGLTVPKWVLINRSKITHMAQNLSAHAQKFGILMKKNFIGHLQSVQCIAHQTCVRATQSYTSQLVQTFEKSCSAQPFGQMKMGWFLAD